MNCQPLEVNVADIYYVLRQQQPKDFSFNVGIVLQ